ncbi:G-type lectin S-receptor-like serine/threonine-protein kinase At1g34300 [Gastrolobium bilobum]|uniref:G-type lectin S-receptor-like serine/threonine-protein kinase At1g34300 n=1 Tax=Gastrolobium bilobum TaxID=150636 RepID=UPI002AB271A1|nr:G-type lectin S-receptor-like serine/threonine-protein kinase At1g34300 [Gastrolobium bilobum]
MLQTQEHPLLLFFIFFSIFISTIAGTTTILPGTTLYASNTTQSWSSPNNTFSLHFLPLQPSTSPPSFIAAVVYSGGVPAVWSAGKGAAVDSGGSLRFLSAGNLRLVNGSGSTVWESGTSNMGVSSAMLHDNGNLVLSNGTGTVWSSFDNPTDTIVPSQNFTVGMVLSYGLYSFSVLRSGNLTLKWNDSVPYWDQGLNSSMSVVNLSSPVLGLQSVGILQLFDPNLTAPVVVAYSSDYAEGSDVLRILKLDGDGNLRIYSSKRGSGIVTVRWVAVEDQCDVFGYCGNNGICSYSDSNPICGCPSQNFEMVDPNDSRKGCERKVRLADCVGKEAMLQVDHTRFLTYPPVFLINPEIFFIGISPCSGNCLASSSCSASTSLSDGTGLCYIKTTNFISGYHNPALPSTSYIKVCGPSAPNSPPLSDNAGQGKDWSVHAWIVAVVVFGTLLGFLAFEGGLWLWCCRNSPGFGGFAAQYALLEYASGAPVHFSYKELQRSTKGFKEKLGDGGFGAVYRGILANKTVVAVKQLEGIEQGEKQFRMEVSTISSTHHLNLVRLIGFCSEGRHRLLVYEFMKNGSLDNFLFVNEEQSGKLLNWGYRFNIALDAARGLTYLHEECRNCIVHCDVKPENILLDENYNAKVSDFGLAKLLNPTDRRRTLTSVRGTRGYLAPEWIANLPITSKSDVYSYGMVLLEIVSGRRNFEISEETSRKKFSIWAYEEFEKGNIMGVIDSRLVSQEVNLEQAKRVLLACFWCIQEHPSQRPTMGKVLQMLEGVTDIEMPPSPKSITVGSSSGINSNATSISTIATSSVPTCSPSSSLLT